MKKIILFFAIISSNLAGTLIQKRNAKEEIILKQRLPKGTYIINYQNQSKKFLN